MPYYPTSCPEQITTVHIKQFSVQPRETFVVTHTTSFQNINLGLFNDVSHPVFQPVDGFLNRQFYDNADCTLGKEIVFRTTDLSRRA